MAGGGGDQASVFLQPAEDLVLPQSSAWVTCSSLPSASSTMATCLVSSLTTSVTCSPSNTFATSSTSMSSERPLSSVAPPSLPSYVAPTPSLLEFLIPALAANREQQAAPSPPLHSTLPGATSDHHQQQAAMLAEVASLEARLASLKSSHHAPHGATPPSYSVPLPSYGAPPPLYSAPLPSYSAPLQHLHPPPQYATAEEYLRTQQRLPAASPAEEVMQQLVRLLQPSTTLTPPSSQHCFIPTPPAAAAPPHRGGAAGKSTRAAEWAKLCKAPHASKASADRVNQNLWSFGFIKHLVATKTGVLPPLPQEEEVARLRHFLDIMETTALHSSGSDFQCHGWQIARDYDARVMADLEQGEVSWSTIATAASVTRNYNQAVHCNSKPAPVTRRGGQGGGADDGDAPRICKSYNEGTCTFEAANPSRPCKFSHICSHCAAAGFSFQHKQVDCRHRRSGARRGSASTTPATTASQQS